MEKLSAAARNLKSKRRHLTAVLINQTHSYRDLFLPISATEKRLFDAIDGTRTIGAIAERALPSSPNKSRLDMTRSFFERLWRYDQVVFDASAGSKCADKVEA
jgi:hypothetical protein